MDASLRRSPKSGVKHTTDWQEPYRVLPFLFFALLISWAGLLGVWTLNTWCKRRWQTNNLQWIMTTVPLLKVFVLALSFSFWYSCLMLSTCSFWVAFGVFVSRIFFETTCFICFLLIAHGYCIMHEQLSVEERRSISVLASILYLSLTGYKAGVPQFSVLLWLAYGLVLFVIFFRLSRNLTVLREQLQQVQEDGGQMMHSALCTKFTMFKKFQGAMVIMAVAEILMHTRADDVASEYWVRLLLHELIEVGIFFQIGWTFRSREVTRFFTVIPAIHTPGHHVLPPIFSVEMDEKEFNRLNFKDWHIGVATAASKDGNSERPGLVMVQNPSFPHEEVTEHPAGADGS